jgi:hypothetical protein
MTQLAGHDRFTHACKGTHNKGIPHVQTAIFGEPVRPSLFG